MKNLILVFITSICCFSAKAQFGPINIIDADPSMSNFVDMITVDLDNNGFLDIVISASSQSGGAYYYLNQGDNTFSSKIALNQPSNFPRFLASADFNNDGWQDVILTTGAQKNIFLFMNDNGSFTTPIDLSETNESHNNVVTEDFDLDGFADFIITTEGEFDFFRNIDGTSFERIDVDFVVNSEVYDANSADFNHDTFPDLVFGGITFDTFFKTPASFQYEQTFDEQTLGFNIHIVDLNLDDEMDIVYFAPPSTLQISLNQGQGVFTKATAFENLNINTIHSADFDGDGDEDIYVSSNNRLVWFPSNGDGTLQNEQIIAEGNSEFFEFFGALGDLNNDGFEDIIWAAYNLDANENDVLVFQLGGQVLSTPTFAENNFTIYPNPVSEILQINTNGVEVKQISIFDSMGKRIMKTEGQTKSVDVSSLAAGLYFLEITSQGTTTIKKFIKN